MPVHMKNFGFITLLLGFSSIWFSAFAAPPETPEDLERTAKIAEFTHKMETANYPALFEKAAKEFNVPVQILEGISFAETRWEHLTWPPGEMRSPENGMPRPFGIMSLWDNDFFGHNLIEAAQLIGKTPDDLKGDPLDNMRGAAAYLRQLYDKSPKPEGTKENDLESWRYAMADYTGIPEPDLKQQHALSVYEYLAQGFHEYGIKLDAVPDLKLEPMRAEVKKIRDEEDRKRLANYALENSPKVSPIKQALIHPATTSVAVAKFDLADGTNAGVVAVNSPPRNQRIEVFLIFLWIAATLFLLRRRRIQK